MRLALLLPGLLAALQSGAPAPVAQAPALELARGERAPALDWTREVYRLRSQVLGEELRVFAGKPPSFARSRQSFPALVLLDGQYYFDEVLSVVAALNSYGQIPTPVLIAVESHDRRVDFTPAEIQLPDVGGRARAGKYLEFLERELLPAAEATLRAGKPRVLLGHSHAGMLVLHAVAGRPEVFPWVVAVDAPAHHEHGFLAADLLRTLGAAERPPVRVVSLEAVFGWSDEQWAELRGAARPDDLLARSAMDREGHESMLFAASYRGLQELFADSSAIAARALPPLEIEERYRNLAALYGAEVAPPEPLMRQLVEDFLMEGRGQRAGEWLERYVAAYGEPEDLAELSARVEEVAALGEPAETVASLLALPRATTEEMKRHLGTWQGTTWLEDGPRDPVTVRFRVEDGTVQGELWHDVGPVIRLEYIRFRPDGGLEFGFRNGIRPRGLVMYEERTPGGPLEGEIPFRGMRFTPPPGHGHPPFRFELERVE